MTTFDGDPSAGDAVDLRETDEATEAADEAAETTEDTAESAETQGEPAEEVDPAAALKAELRSKPGDWYVIHSYAGYENKVKANLETRVQNLDVGDYIFQVEVPTEEVTEIKNGQRKQVNRKVLPGYILVRMDLTDDSWAAVRNTPGVTGFVGATSR
ncbi:transcription termination/antitermination NusG family protein, partial [Mycobacterium avium]